MDVYLLVTEGQKSKESNGGEGEESERVVGSQLVVVCEINSSGSKSGVVFLFFAVLIVHTKLEKLC